MQLSLDSFDAAEEKQFEEWIRRAKQGDTEALGRLLEACQANLRRWADQELSAPLRVKCAASDLVQETALDAHRGFADFRGEQLVELLAWLRQILRWNVTSAQRRYGATEKRCLAREVSLDDSGGLAGHVPDEAPSPRSLLARIEKQRQVERALDGLSIDQRTAILLRSRDHLSFAEIGERMQRSPEAARKLWFRAIEQLRQRLKTGDESN